jgi:hypothetical protein
LILGLIRQAIPIVLILGLIRQGRICHHIAPAVTA